MAMPATVSRSVQQIQQWLKELRDNGDFTDLDQALALNA